MPSVEFESLPADARVWVFAADAPLARAAATTLLDAVDAFLAQWNAHGHPLQCARAWRDGQFLAVGVDQSTTGASGCSIDGLFRALQHVQPAIGASLLPASRVYWRDASGVVRSAERSEFRQLSQSGVIADTTPVFDTTVNTADAWRSRFECPARDTWHAGLMVSRTTRGDYPAASRESPV